VIHSAKEVASVLGQCPDLVNLSLGLTVSDGPETLSSAAARATIFRPACPTLESFRYFVPMSCKASRRPFVETYQVLRSSWTGNGWTCEKETSVAEGGVFGMLE
jgi:hypothetical protein